MREMTVGEDNDVREDDKKKKNRTKAKRGDKRISSSRMNSEFNRGEESRCKQNKREYSVFPLRQKTVCA